MTSRRGFTLVEVLVALVILSTVMAALAVSRHRQVEQLQAALDRSRAAELAAEELARVVSETGEAEAYAAEAQSSVDGLVTRLSRTKVWLERLPIDVVTVEVYRAERPGDGALVTRTLYRPPPEKSEAGP